MSVYARVPGGMVVELFTPPAGFTLEQCFHPDIASQFVEVPSGVTPAEGWSYSGGVFSAPAPPAPPTLAQQAAAAIAAGCAIVSTATPVLSGTYACDDAAQGRINRVYSLIQRAGGNAFPAGMTMLPWPDVSGAIHTFSSVAEFLAFETAVGGYVLALDMIIATGSGTLPTQPVTIP